MIDINDLIQYFNNNMVFVTAHSSERFRQRGIKIKDIRNAVNNGEIIEQYPDDFPYPSCLILGKSIAGNYIHIVMSDEGNSSRIITAYYPDKNKWDSEFRIRKEI